MSRRSCVRWLCCPGRDTPGTAPGPRPTQGRRSSQPTESSSSSSSSSSSCTVPHLALLAELPLGVVPAVDALPGLGVTRVRVPVTLALQWSISVILNSFKETVQTQCSMFNEMSPGDSWGSSSSRAYIRCTSVRKWAGPCCTDTRLSL